jgi:hypothetical protein
VWTQASENEGNDEFKPLYWIGVSSNLKLPDFDIKNLFPSSFSRNLGGKLVQMKKQSDVLRDELKRIAGK